MAPVLCICKIQLEDKFDTFQPLTLTKKKKVSPNHFVDIFFVLTFPRGVKLDKKINRIRLQAEAPQNWTQCLEITSVILV